MPPDQAPDAGHGSYLRTTLQPADTQEGARRARVARPAPPWRLLRLAVSRQREELADADAALLTRYPAGLARALAKIAGASGAHTLPAGAAAHLYLAEPRASPGGWGGLLATHPPIERRIARLAAMDPSLPPVALDQARAAGAAYGFAAASLVVAAAHGEDRAPSFRAAPRRALTVIGAFRLREAGTPLYPMPDAAAEPVTRLPAGAIITVQGVADGFTRVLTADDIEGYIRDTTAMTPIDRMEV